MPLTKIKADKNGRLFVQTNGSVFRPERTTPFQGEYLVGRKYTTVFNVGDEVKVSHITCTPFARLKTDSVEEIWVTHGCYLTPGGTKVEDCWVPA